MTLQTIEKQTFIRIFPDNTDHPTQPHQPGDLGRAFLCADEVANLADLKAYKILKLSDLSEALSTFPGSPPAHSSGGP